MAFFGRAKLVVQIAETQMQSLLRIRLHEAARDERRFCARWDSTAELIKFQNTATARNCEEFPIADHRKTWFARPFAKRREVERSIGQGCEQETVAQQWRGEVELSSHSLRCQGACVRKTLFAPGDDEDLRANLQRMP